MKLKHFSLLLLIPIIVSCASAPPPAVQQDKEMVFTVENQKVFDAVKTYFFENDIEIVAGSKDSGFLTARKKLNSEMTTAILLGSAKVIYTNYNISFIQLDNSTKVMVKIATAYADGSYSSEAPQAEYQKFWAILKSKLSII